MNYSLKNTNPDDINKWVNEAIKQKAIVVLIIMNNLSHDSVFEPCYLTDEKVILKEVINAINEIENYENYSLRFIIDMKTEIQRWINEGLTSMDINDAKEAFLYLKFGSSPGSIFSCSFWSNFFLFKNIFYNRKL